MDEIQFDDAGVDTFDQLYFGNETDGNEITNMIHTAIHGPNDNQANDNNLDFDTFLETCVTPRLVIQHYPVEKTIDTNVVADGAVIPTESKPGKRKYNKRKNVESRDTIGAGMAAIATEGDTIAEPPAKKQRKPYKPRAPKIKDPIADPIAPPTATIHPMESTDIITFDQFDRFLGFNTEPKNESNISIEIPRTVPAPIQTQVQTQVSAPMQVSAPPAPVPVIRAGSSTQKCVSTADISIFIPKSRVSKTRSAINASACWAVYQRFLLYGQQNDGQQNDETSAPTTKTAVSLVEIRDASIKLFAQSVARQCKIDGEITQDEIPTKEEFIINELFDHQRITPPRKNMFMTNCHYTVLLSVLNGQQEEARTAAFTAISKKNNNRQNQAIFRSKKGKELRNGSTRVETSIETRAEEEAHPPPVAEIRNEITKVPKKRGRPPRIVAPIHVVN